MDPKIGAAPQKNPIIFCFILTTWLSTTHTDGEPWSIVLKKLPYLILSFCQKKFISKSLINQKKIINMTVSSKDNRQKSFEKLWKNIILINIVHFQITWQKFSQTINGFKFFKNSILELQFLCYKWHKIEQFSWLMIKWHKVVHHFLGQND